jgi:hypothetical protein
MKFARALPLIATFIAATTLPAPAATLLAAIPVGSSENYHVTTQSATPQGPKSSNNYVQIKRSAPTVFAVSIDGAAPVIVTVNGFGQPTSYLPQELRVVMTPFTEVAKLMAGAPQPMAPNSAWGATLPVPVDGQTDTVPLSVSVPQFSSTGMTVVAAGQSSTEVQPGVRAFPTGVSVNATMFYNATGLLTQASGATSIVIHKRLRRTDHFGNNWTVSLVGN